MYFFTERNYYNMKNTLIDEIMYRKYTRFAKFMFLDIFMALNFLVVAPDYSKVFSRPVIGLLKQKLFKNDYPPWKKVEVPQKTPENAIDISGGAQKDFAKKIKSLNFKLFNKSVILDRAGITGVVPLFMYLMAKEFYVMNRDDGKILFYGKSSILQKILFL
jgi:hypothetical protein